MNMPRVRNVSYSTVERHSVYPRRQSGRLGHETPLVYDKEGWGWPITESVDCSIEQQDSTPFTFKQEQQDELFTIPPVTLSPSPSSHPPSPIAPDYVPGEHHPTGSSLSSFDQSTPPPFVPSNAPIASSSGSYVPVPPRKNSHSRRRDPGHIPRPKNAFIIFRSDYISQSKSRALLLASSDEATPAGENQQNELSKHAGKVWNRMSPQARQPYLDMAAIEKEEHMKKYPNYTYAPGGRGHGAGAKAAAKLKAAAVASANAARRRKSVAIKAKKWSRSYEDSSMEPELATPPFSVPSMMTRTALPRRAAAQLAVERIVIGERSASPSPMLILDQKAETESPFGIPGLDEFVPTDEIPVLELTPKEEVKEIQPRFEDVDLAPREYPYDSQDDDMFVGFKPYVEPSAMLSCLPKFTSTPMLIDSPLLYPTCSSPSIPSGNSALCPTFNVASSASSSTSSTCSPPCNAPKFELNTSSLLTDYSLTYPDLDLIDLDYLNARTAALSSSGWPENPLSNDSLMDAYFYFDLFPTTCDA